MRAKRKQHVLGLLGLCLLTVQPLHAQGDNSLASRLLKEYAQEVASARRNREERRALHEKWEKRFSAVLAQPTGGWTDSGLRLRSELGALQRELGYNERAFATWLGWAVGARELGRTRDRLVALSSLWSLTGPRDTDQRRQTVDLIDEAYRDLRPHITPPVEADFADLFASMAIVYRNEGKRRIEGHAPDTEEGKRGKQLLADAAVRMRQSLAIPSEGTKTRVQRQFALGGILLAAGDRKGTSKQFGEILAMGKQTTYAKTWVAHRKARADFDPDSPDYIKALEGILRDYKEDRYTPVLKQALAGRYLRVSKDYQKAANLYRQIIDLPGQGDGVNATNMMSLASCLSALKQQEKARQVLRDILKRYGHTALAGPARDRLREIEKADATGK